MGRRTAIVGLALALASPALAQSNRGALGLDARLAPTTGIGVTYYLTDNLSLGPWLGLGYSGVSGFYANLGAQARLELLVDRRFSPYLSATAQYSHYGNAGTTSTLGPGGVADQPLALASNLAQFGTGAGARARVSRSVMLFAEARAMYATAPIGSLGTGWSTVGINDRTRVDVLLGLTYLFR
jgi:hypothetical protein